MFNRIVTEFGLLLVVLGEGFKKKSLEPVSEGTKTKTNDVSPSEVKTRRIIVGAFPASGDPDFDPRYDLDYYFNLEWNRIMWENR